MTHLTKIYQHYFQRPLALSALALAVPWQAGLAATRNVDTTVDNGAFNVCSVAANDCSLRGAITAAVAGDTITVPAGTYTLAGTEIPISVSLTITGAGSASTIIDGANASRIFNISAGPITINGVTIQNGNSSGSGGGVSNSNTQLTLNNIKVLNNTATGNGGGLYVNGGSVTISNSIFTSNSVTTPGSSQGGAFYIPSGTTISVDNTTFTSNNSSKDCGAIATPTNATVTVTNSTFSNNTATNAVGAFCAGGNVTITNSQLINNADAAVTGGVYNWVGSIGPVVLTNVLLANNTSGNITASNFASTAPVTFYHVTITSNSLNPKPAIMLNSAGNLTVKDTIIANHAIGILNNVNGTVTEDYNLFFGNTTNISNPSGTLVSGGNSVTGDPLFFNPAANDYHLTLGSAAIDKGVGGLGVTTDFEGDARPFGSAPDIGWDEAVTYNLILAMTGNGTGTVSSSGTPAGASCGVNCVTYLSSSAVSLAATANTGSSLASWNCTPAFTSGNHLTANTTCTATFTLGALPPPPPSLPSLPDYLGLFLQLDGTGTGKVTSDTGLSCQSSDCQRALDGSLTCNPQTCTQAVKTASSVTLTPQANVGSTFSSWGGHPDCVTGQFMMDSGKLCIAFFHLLDEPLTVTVQGQGHVTDTNLHCSDKCVVNYLYGTAVTLLASPATDWLFQGWSGDCNSTGQVLMTDPKTCGATFIPDPATVDNDLDHITSAIEDAAPNHGDGNGDGIPDSQQNNVASFVDLVSGKYLTLQVDKTCPITNVYSDFPAHYPNVDPNHHFPQGLTYFELSCAKTQVTVYYHGISKLYSNLRFYKYGPTVPGDMKTVGWYKYPATFAVVQIGGQPVLTATYTLTDGQLGDSTGVDGKIVDPGGVALE